MTLASVPREVLAVAFGLALLACLVQLVSTRLGALARSRKARVRAARAGDGERAAVVWLEDAGFAIEAAQATGTYEVALDGEVVEIPLRADYVVSRGERRWVAEVKTGAVAPRIATAATRRQLLEYLVAFDVDGVLLVDAERGVVHDVSFPTRDPMPAPRAPARAFVLVLAGLAGGAALGAFVQAAAAGASSAGAGSFTAIPESTHLRATSSATGLTSATHP